MFLYFKAAICTLGEILIIGAAIMFSLHAIDYLIESLGPDGFLGGAILFILSAALVTHLYLANLDRIRDKKDKKNDLRAQR